MKEQRPKFVRSDNEGIPPFRLFEIGYDGSLNWKTLHFETVRRSGAVPFTMQARSIWIIPSWKEM
ncbi:MAG: hypothetical protein R3C44_09420 [Chloroflexota bacterium]